MTLREACLHFADQGGEPLPDTTLRDLIRRHQVPTLTERRQSGRGVRPMVVIPPQSLLLIAAALSPELREVREEPVREDDSPPGALERGGSDQAEVGSETLASLSRIADLEKRLAIAEMRGSPAAPRANEPQATSPIRRPNVLLREIATRAVYAARLACCAVLWLYLPEQIAAALSPLPRATSREPRTTTTRYLPRLREARAA